MVIVAELVCIIPSIPVAGCSGKNMTADGADQEFPEIQVGIFGLTQLRCLFPFAIQDFLNVIKGFLFSAMGHPCEQFAKMILRGSVTPISHEEWPIGSFCRRDSRNRFGISSPQGSTPSPACCGAGSC